MSRRILIITILFLSSATTMGILYFVIAKIGNSISKIENEEILINGGTFKRPNSNEIIEIKSFYIDKNLTTVAEFDEFVNATGYITEANKFGNSAVLVDGNWALVDGANYWYPFGIEKPKAEPNHPVTQVSWNDAVAYAKWKGKRLPTEAEWEFVATNRGASSAKFPWGNDLVVNGKYLANTFQGKFPLNNTALDGYEFTSPVGSFPANELGITDIGGNVWQWCADTLAPTQEEASQDPGLRHPSKGASFQTDASLDPNAAIFAHSTSTAETGVSHTGFRLVKEIK